MPLLAGRVLGMPDEIFVLKTSLSPSYAVSFCSRIETSMRLSSAGMSEESGAISAFEIGRR